MNHPLDGARLKIVRAQEHLDSLKREAGAFLSTDPYTFESQIYGEHWWIKPHISTDPPLRLSAIMGDCVTNIRASLDYIIWEMANKWFTKQPDITQQADRQILNFPILLADPSRKQGHIDHLDRLTRRGFPTDAIRVIQNAQADVSGDNSLQLLYDLVNGDKHRMPILTIATFSTAQIEVTNYKGRNWTITSDAIKNGVAIKAEPTLLQAVASGDVKVHVQAAMDVTFSDFAMPREPIDLTLTNILKTVSDLIPRFNLFL